MDLNQIKGRCNVMSLILIKPVSKIIKLSLWLAVLTLVACTDSSYNVPEDAAVVIVQPPEVPEALSVVISGVVVDQTTGDVIDTARVDFFEGSQKATNILTVEDGSPTDGDDLTNGSFQVTAEDIEEFNVVVSADGYLDKVATVKLDSQVQIVTVILELLAQDIEGVAANTDVFEDSIGQDFAVKAEGISLTSDNPNSEKTTEGQAEIVIGGGIQFLDSNNQVIEVSAINLEVNYIESQEATEEGEEAVSMASLIPEGLNSDSTIDEILVPVGVTEVNMTDENGTPIKNFSDDITITIYLPDTTVDPKTNNPITVDSEFRVRTFNSETLTWTTEPEGAVNVREKTDGLFPVEVTVNHLTIFALTSEVAACTNDVTFDFLGDAVPATGLDLILASGDLRKTIFVPSAADSLVILADEVKSSGIMKDEDDYKVYVKDSLGNSWISVAEDAESAENQASVETVINVPAVQADTQHVYVSDGQISEDGSQITVTISYLANDANTTGVGMTVNFDSSVLSVNEISNILTDVIASGTQFSDSNDSDGDSSTDQRLTFGWASLFGSFPGSTSAELVEVTFDIADGASGSTRLNLVETSSAAGYTFEGQAQDVVFSESASSDGYQLCVEEDIVINLENPVQSTAVSENLTLYLQCTNDSLIKPLLANAVVTYRKDSNPIPLIAAENSPGTYQLSGLDSSTAYTISVNTRTDAGVVEFSAKADNDDADGIQLDGADQARNIGISCSSATGTGTGTGSGSS